MITYRRRKDQEQEPSSETRAPKALTSRYLGLRTIQDAVMLSGCYLKVTVPNLHPSPKYSGTGLRMMRLFVRVKGSSGSAFKSIISGNELASVGIGCVMTSRSSRAAMRPGCIFYPPGWIRHMMPSGPSVAKRTGLGGNNHMWMIYDYELGVLVSKRPPTSSQDARDGTCRSQV